MMNIQEVGNFSSIKWVTFQLSRFRPNRPSGSFFNYQMGNFSIDKNRSHYLQVYSPVAENLYFHHPVDEEFVGYDK